MKTPEYRRGYQAGYRVAKKGGRANPEAFDNKLLHDCMDRAEERAYQECIDLIEEYQVPVGNSAAGEMAAWWTMEALREVRAKIQAKVASRKK